LFFCKILTQIFTKTFRRLEMRLWIWKIEVKCIKYISS
jgi:hypothetical protein